MDLSDSLEDLLDKHLLHLIWLRRRIKLSWAAAEELLWQSEAALDDPENFFLGKRRCYLMQTRLRGNYLLLQLCGWNCVIYHKQFENKKYEALKPTSAEFWSFLGAYVAAAEGALEEPFPCGMGLRVPVPQGSTVIVDNNGLCNFDALPVQEMCKMIITLLDRLPPTDDFGP
ncbi:hypothetical protein BKA82DRAFT_939646 [Pisolithus tinctorius]|uniref:Uncharacterized protein n=1 Tax=Pisolithus tinctorius Marx 270 TaxID=870435 RepID=A0A0C3JFX7_PISTI|nr:hypothetical protein BKA82DRAFT_939646 [Pisolithus tinctorius]KIO07983.1 hypothetical protein M404DRAFT_939646 [Pisolithus tinctorius Marx 270]